MKFDKFMEWCYRGLCILVSAVVVAACVISCSAPLSASAESFIMPDWYFDYLNDSSRQFLEVEQNRRDLIKPEIDSALSDSSLSESDKNTILSITSLQDISFQSWLDFYESNYNNNVSFGSGSFNVSGSGYSGLYYTTDNVLHYGTWHVNSPNIFTSDKINLSYHIISENVSFNQARFTVRNSDLYNSIAFNIVFPFMCNFEIVDTGGYMATASYSNATGGDLNILGYSSNSLIPTISTSDSIKMFRATSPMTKGLSTLLSLPSATVSDETPWAYYNNYLLPYIRQNYNIDNIDNYLWFPNGYTPTVTPDIFSPSVNFGGVGVGGLGGIIAGAGAIINVGGVGTVNVFAPIQGQIRIDGVQLQFPVDLPDSVYVNRNQVSIPTVDPIEIAGHVLDMISNTHFTFDGVDFTINADGTISISGTPYTLPIGTPTQPDTTPYEYMYEVPTMEHIELIEPTIEPVGLSSFKDGITGFYGLGARLYYDLGLFRPLLICLGLAGVGYAISRIGGH